MPHIIRQSSNEELKMTKFQKRTHEWEILIGCRWSDLALLHRLFLDDSAIFMKLFAKTSYTDSRLALMCQMNSASSLN